MLRSLTVSAVALALAVVSGAAPSQATFPGQNGDILFVSSRDGDDAIFRMDADAQNQVKLADSNGVDSGPAWSPDGTRIAFTSERDGNREIYVMNADGSQQLRLTNNTASDFEPTWSADGQTIAFRSDGQGGGIVTVPASGGTAVPLISSGGTLSGPAYSPDGTQIVYKSDAGAGPFTLRIANANGTNSDQLTNDVFHEDDPNWSPDSSKIVFVRALTAPAGIAGLGGQTDIFVINRNGTGLVNLTNDIEHDSEPAWSPDGTKIIFYSERAEGDGLYTMNPDGSGLALLLEDVFSPDWQPVPEGAFKWGDADCSGTVDPIDALKTLRNDAGLSVTAEPDCPELGADVQIGSSSYAWGDIDCSDAADPVDALKLIRHDAGLTVAKPADCYTIDDFVVVVP